MNKLIHLVALFSSLFLFSGISFGAENVVAVAIFDFESKDEAVRDLGPKIAVLLNANLSAEQGIITVERADSKKSWANKSWGCPGRFRRIRPPGSDI